MKLILNKLHNDHVNFFKLLEFLEAQTQLLRDCKHFDLELIIDALRYMQEYPDFIHHPMENTIYQYFLDHHDGLHNELNFLLQEHDELPDLTNKLMQMLQALSVNEPQNREKLCGYLTQYIRAQKEHMDREESPVYTTIDATLCDRDWENINSELVFSKDPMFGDQTKRCYQELLQRVID